MRISRGLSAFPEMPGYPQDGICGHGFGLYSLRAHRGLFRAGAQPWDFAAGMLIVAEAGGRVTRLDGSP